MGSKSSAPAAPDYTPIANANAESAKIAADAAKEQLNWAKQQYADNKQIADKVVGSALNTQAINDKNAAADRARYEGIYQPLEGQLATEAQNYATPGRQEYEMGRAQANVAQQMDAQRNAATANLESYGVDPSSTRFAALDRGSKVAQGAAEAAAGNQAQQQTEAMGRAMRSEAINVGRGYPGQIAQTYGTALQSGNQGINSAIATTQSGANTMGTAPQYMGMQNQALGNWGNTLTQGYNAQLNQFNADQNASSGIGSLIGTGLGFMGKAGMFAGFAEGGAVPDDVTPGGNVPDHASPSQGKAIDDVPARLTAGEFVVPKDVLSWKGEEFFQNVIKKSRDAKGDAPAKPKYALAPDEQATFTSRPNGALPVG
jgi:hypothetical protein